MTILDYMAIDLMGLRHVQHDAAEAVLSDDLKYRYALSRVWDPTLNTMVWVMLNPSTADAALDDPTIRKCRGFAERNGCGTIVVVNCFAFRATDPQNLAKALNPNGVWNQHVVTTTLSQARYKGWTVVGGWGRFPSKTVAGMAANLTDQIRKSGLDVKCFGYTKDGQPRHPLMLSYAASLVPLSATPFPDSSVL